MDPTTVLKDVGLMVGLSVLPSLVYLIFIRYSERYEREPWSAVLVTFLWGGTIGVLIAILLQGMAITELENRGYELATFPVMTVVYPASAEIAKPLGLLAVRREIDEVEDGLIYGCAAGLGFAATENILFGINNVINGQMGLLSATVVLRALTVVLIHGGVTALTGYGIGRKIAPIHSDHKKHYFFIVIPYFIAAILIHAIFNGFLYMDEVMHVEVANVQDVSLGLGVIFAIAVAFGTLLFVNARIWKLDRIDDPKRRVVPASPPYLPPMPSAPAGAPAASRGTQGTRDGAGDPSSGGAIHPTEGPASPAPPTHDSPATGRFTADSGAGPARAQSRPGQRGMHLPGGYDPLDDVDDDLVEL